MFKYILLAFSLLTIGCSKPVVNSQFTIPLSLSKSPINSIVFLNSQYRQFTIDENLIESKLIKMIAVKNNISNKKPLKLSINLYALDKELSKELESTFNIHNTLAIATQLMTGYETDTSSIDSNRVKMYRFIINIKLNDILKSKLLIEIIDEDDVEKVKELFMQALLDKIEEIL